MIDEGESVTNKFWDLGLKACIGMMPFVVSFMVWTTTQIYDLKSEQKLATQARETIATAQKKVERDIEEIKQAQLQILLVLEQLKVLVQKSQS